MPTTHTPRFNYYAAAPDLFAQMSKLSQAIHHAGLPEKLLALIEIRASQINGCAFCLDMHSKQAKLAGERELRLYAVAAWRDSTLFDERERAALRWTEELTRLGNEGVSDSAFEELRQHFKDPEIAQLTLAVAMINAWNRVSISTRAEPGSMDKQLGLDKAVLT